MSVSQLPRRLARWLVITAVLAALMLGVAGRRDLPMLNAYVVTCAVVLLWATLIVDPDRMKERLRRGPKGEDPVRLALIRIFFLATFALALFDIGRLHWSDSVPRGVQVAALAAAAVSFSLTLWALSVNRFFVPAVRIQSERGHEVVTRGPYARVRHPGYAGMVLGAPATALALGSWWALLPAIAVSFLFLRRTAHEDRFLREHLGGYADYARRVRYRLVPGLW